MKTFATTFIKNGPALHQFKYAFLGLFFIFLAFGSIVSAWENFAEWNSDDREWFTYIAVEPFQEGVDVNDVAFAVGEPPRFTSDNIFLKSGDIRWEDTLKCRQEGGVELYDTQYWPEGFVGDKRATQRVIANSERDQFTDSGEDTTWSYTVEPVHPTATECKICGVIFVYTSHGYEKTDTYCTENWFGVNK